MPQAPGDKMAGIPNHPSDPIPETVTLSADRIWLSAAWADGRQVRLTANSLRAACRCATCTRARIDGLPAQESEMRITAIHPHGPNVGRLTFSDGHDRGLYPWTWLLELGATPPEYRS